MTSSEVSGNSVFITGATSGIGKETTALFLAKGWRVFATARTDALAIKLHEEFDHPNLEVITCEVHIEESCESAIKRVLELVPSGPNIIVNNAGFALPAYERLYESLYLFLVCAIQLVGFNAECEQQSLTLVSFATF